MKPVPEIIAYVAVIMSGLAFVLILAILLSLYLPARKPSKRRLTSYSTRHPTLFELAMSDAVELNQYDIAHANDPGVRLATSARYAPLEYRAAVVEISRQIKVGSVVSVDLRKLDRMDAARVTDFCSGLVAATGGWIFRVASEVIILTPGPR